jgi:hypothetical protein
MTDRHIPFDRLSDLHDGEIEISDDKEVIIGHLGECFQCRTEMDRLHNTIMRCVAFRETIVCMDGFHQRTMKVIRWRRRRHSFMKAMPAVAASIAIVGGVTLFNSGVPGQEGSVRQKSTAYVSSAVTDTEKIVDILGGNNARILTVSDYFIEGEIEAGQFNKLRRDLGFRKVVYNVVAMGGSQEQPRFNRNIRTVGSMNPMIVGASQLSSPVPGSQYIRFRVFK